VKPFIPTRATVSLYGNGQVKIDLIDGEDERPSDPVSKSKYDWDDDLTDVVFVARLDGRTFLATITDSVSLEPATCELDPGCTCWERNVQRMNAIVEEVGRFQWPEFDHDQDYG
jgi:hypothetical protein